MRRLPAGFGAVRRALGMLTRRGLAASTCALAWACQPVSEPCDAACDPVRSGPQVVNFHGDRERLGWYRQADALAPEAIAAGAFGLRWSSDPFPTIEVGGTEHPSLMYASVLHVEAVEITAGAYAGSSVNLAVGATTSGSVYAINTGCHACRADAGRVVWTAQLGEPSVVERFDGGLPLGVLGTPTIDLETGPPTLYVASMDATAGWQVHALTLDSGEPLAGWPVQISDAALAPVNRNGPARFFDPEVMSQRGALALSGDGERLYVTFGSFWGQAPGWLISIDTATASIRDAFSSAPEVAAESNGGIWGSAGPAVADNGELYVTTGNSPPGSEDAPNVWGNSLLRFDADLRLLGSYTPFNYCRLDAADLDLAGSQPVLLPPLPSVSTPNTVAFGSKQGNVYLVDRDTMIRTDRRPPCSLDPATDASLVAPDPQPHFGEPGPLNVFGPYSDLFGMIDQAKMRSKLAYFEDAAGQPYLLASGATKSAPASEQSVPPSIAKLRVATPSDKAAYLTVEATNEDVVFINPGSPFVTSQGSDDAVVWVLDRNAPRTMSPADPATPRPVLYAFDAASLALLWQSPPDLVSPTGKYVVGTSADGMVLVGGDRIQAFGVP